MHVLSNPLINDNQSFTIDSHSKTVKQIAWVFPGQSSQTLGMGLDLLPYPFARARLQQAQQIFRKYLRQINLSKSILPNATEVRS